MVVYYSIPSTVEEPIRIVQLSDLHDATFGKDNEKLVEIVREQQPDLIFLTGDMLSEDTDSDEKLIMLIEQLTQIAPTYYGLGNHEKQWIATHKADLIQDAENAGAVVLEMQFKDVTVKGSKLRIGGYSGYYGAPLMDSSDNEYQQQFFGFQQRYEDTDRTKLLLSHIPTSWLEWKYIDKYDVDVVFSGHYHGGEVRLPFIGGVYAPYVGWWPVYTEGVFYGEKGICVLSTGLGSSHSFRFHNPPQVVSVELVPDS